MPYIKYPATKNHSDGASAIVHAAAAPISHAATSNGLRPMRSERYPAGMCDTIIIKPNTLKIEPIINGFAPNSSR